MLKEKEKKKRERMLGLRKQDTKVWPFGMSNALPRRRTKVSLTCCPCLLPPFSLLKHKEGLSLRFPYLTKGSSFDRKELSRALSLVSHSTHRKWRPRIPAQRYCHRPPPILARTAFVLLGSIPSPHPPLPCHHLPADTQAPDPF